MLQSVQEAASVVGMTGVGLRERKKSETRRAIAGVALQLAIERGPDAVTVEDIAAAADVSPRSVFNYFGTKDQAILGLDPSVRTEILEQLTERPAEETPLEALAAVLTRRMTGGDDDGRIWRARAELVRQHPRLRAAQVTSQAALEQELTLVVAQRTGLDPERDAYPALVVAVALSALRNVLGRSRAGNRQQLASEIDEAFALLATGLAPVGRGRR